MAAQKRRYGYRRLHILLVRDGIAINRKKTYLIYREAGLAVRCRKRKCIADIERTPAPLSMEPNEAWSMDFVSDGLADGRRIRYLNIVDDYTRECLAIEVDSSLTERRVVAVMDRLRESRGLPLSITLNNGAEFTCQKLDEWAFTREVKLSFIQPGKPTSWRLDWQDAPRPNLGDRQQGW